MQLMHFFRETLLKFTLYVYNPKNDSKTKIKRKLIRNSFDDNDEKRLCLEYLMKMMQYKMIYDKTHLG